LVIPWGEPALRACRRTSGIAIAAGLGLALATGTALAAGSNVTVSLTNAGPSPASVTVPPGGKVTWKSTQGAHTVSDASKLKLFNGVTSYVYKFAGTYPYKVSGASKGGSVGVPVKLTKGKVSGLVAYNVRWASTDVSSPYTASVMYKAPGGKWSSFVFRSVGTHDATFIPSQYGNKHGTYSFRAELEKGGAATAWSPIASFTY
jgi:plastocyanin